MNGRVRQLDGKDIRAFEQVVDGTESRKPVEGKFGDSGNWALVHGIVHGGNADLAPADGAENIEAVVADGFEFGRSDFTLPREADSHDEIEEVRASRELLGRRG